VDASIELKKGGEAHADRKKRPADWLDGEKSRENTVIKREKGQYGVRFEYSFVVGDMTKQRRKGGVGKKRKKT